MKQGTLFSFFTKKTPSKSSPKVADASKSVSSTSSKASTRSTDKSSNEPLSQVSVEGADPKLKEIKVGTRLSVLWPDDAEYYDAKVTKINRGIKNTDSQVLYTLLYDDGEMEELDLSGESFKLLPDKQETRKHSIDDDELGFDIDSDDDEPRVTKKKFQNKRIITEINEPNKRSRLSKLPTAATDAVSPTVLKARNAVTPPSNESTSSKMASYANSVQDTQGDDSPNALSSVFTQYAIDTPSAEDESMVRDGVMNASPKSTKMAGRENNRSPAPSNAKGGVPATDMFQDGAVNPAGTHLHNHLSFLYPPNLRDGNGNLSTSADYDPRTLSFGPKEENEILKLTKQAKLTPASKQWWEIKSQYFDTILFFKTGKFYELYHMDADVGCKELGFVYMRGIAAHSGFPEAAYGVMSGKLVNLGYKVARVEQTESPEQLAIRKKSVKNGPKPMVVNREVCCISSIGTRTYCFLDDTRCFNSGSSDISHGPLLSIREIILPHLEHDESDSDDTHAHCEYGVTIVDAVRSTIVIGQFADDLLRTRLHTLLTTFAPSEILLDPAASKELNSLIQMSQTARVERVREEESFPTSTAINPSHRKELERSSPCRPWDVEETVSELHRKQYFAISRRSKKAKPQNFMKTNDISNWPQVLRACVEGRANLALSSFGAALYYLQRSLVDLDILSFGNVKAYVPPGSPVANEVALANVSQNHETGVPMPQSTINMTLSALSAQMAAEEGGLTMSEIGDHSKSSAPTTPKTSLEQAVHNPCPLDTDHMQLDGTTIENLEILVNQADQTVRNSLWAKLNHTKTPHGNRLLRAWLLRPLFRKSDIDRRLDAVAELSAGSAALVMSEARPLLSKVGDLDRLLSRVHSMGGGAGAACDAHPNERAMLYEGPVYTKRKVEDFRRILVGLEYAGKVVDLFSPENCADLHSGLLRKILRRQRDGGIFPDSLEEELGWFRDNFDVDKAKEGLFEPTPGMDEDYDEACAEVTRLTDELQQYQIDMCRQLGHNAKSHWKYLNTKQDSRDKYMIELPVSVPVPDEFYVKGKRGKGPKQVNKYRTKVVEDLVNALEKALDEQKAGKDRGMQLVFQKFDSSRPLWSAAAQVTAMLDALGSLAHVSSLPDMVRPTILDCDDNSSPVIYVRQGRHFCVDVTHYGGSFIPNDLMLGGNDDNGSPLSRVLLLSGPNMGGKSTLLRQTCLIALLGQIGCFVPAWECSFTPLDRIFTRLGATDRILAGQSTFFVELAETAAALRGATRRSLVIMDELGRGTSTFDGTAIASATVQHLVESNGCLALFATHYHTLLEDWKDEPSVRLGHMECIVHGNNDEVEASANGKSDHMITFLYTLGEGSCPKSFGINVARLAGLPEEVLQSAKKKSCDFEAVMWDKQESEMTAEELLIEQLKDAVSLGDAQLAEEIWKKLV